MHFNYLIKKKFVLTTIILLIVEAVAAQTTTPAPPTETSGYNQLAALLVIMTAILAFVLWGLGQILLVLSKQLLDKNKNASKIITSLLVVISLLASQHSSAQDTAKEMVTVVPNYGGLSSTTFYFFVTVIATEVIAILFIVFSIKRIYAEFLPPKEVATIKKVKIKSWWAGLDKRIFTKAVAVEKEADIMLDHDYDGIRELDNALPPWWKYGFLITIFIAIIYLLNFHVFGTGKNPTEEYVAEMEQARSQKEIFEAGNKDKIDEEHVPFADADGLVKAKEIFTTKCFTCHGKEGEGGAGPNLTDDYWLHKGSLNDIYYTIKNGYPDKGMQSWTNDYTPKEISFLASYVKLLRGSKPPNAKAPQGDLFADAIVTDSTQKSVTDTIAAKK